MQIKKFRAWLIGLGVAALIALPLVINSCGSSSSTDGGGETTTHTITLKGATS